MLFKEHSNSMSNCRTRNHVNFKSLVNYLGKNKTYLSTSLDTIVKSLIEKQVITKEMMDVLMTRYSDEISYSGDSKYFKVKTITLDEELLKSLNVNYTYQHIEEFTPEGAVDITEIHGNLEELNAPEEILSEVEEVEEGIEITDEDIEDSFTRIERNELKSELIALEEANPVSESELNKELEESHSNNITQTNDTDFEWF
jgi:hypothetical protein